MDHRLAGVGVLIPVVVAVAVVPGLAGRRVAGSAVAETFPDPPAIGDCATSAPSGQGGSFGEPSNATIQRVAPGDEERRAGRSWLACLVTTSSGQTYRGTLAQGFGTGRVPDEYGLCWNGTDLDDEVNLIPCDQPHSNQLLAIGSATDRSLVAQVDLEAACRDIATVLMRTDLPVSPVNWSPRST